MKKNKYEIDMCNGTIMDKLISFSLPLMVSGILQLMFNAVDIIVVGRFSGSQALAAVGSTTALINVFINLFMGISLGANVLAARYYNVLVSICKSSIFFLSWSPGQAVLLLGTGCVLLLQDEYPRILHQQAAL